VSFLGAVAPGSELICTAEVVSGGRRVAFVEASVVARAPHAGARAGAGTGAGAGAEDERLVARASSTYIYKDRD